MDKRMSITISSGGEVISAGDLASLLEGVPDSNRVFINGKALVTASASSLDDIVRLESE